MGYTKKIIGIMGVLVTLCGCASSYKSVDCEDATERKYLREDLMQLVVENIRWEDETGVPTEAQTELQTEAPTEPPTEAPTETPTEAPTEPPTEAETETKPNGYVEIKKNGNYFLYVGTPYYLGPGQWECSKDKNYCIADGEQIFYVRETGTYKLIMIK